MIRDKWTMSTARDGAGEQLIPPIPPFSSSLLSISRAPQGLAVFFPGCCAHACCPHKCHHAVGTPQGPCSQPAATPGSSGGETRGRSPALARLSDAWKGVTERLPARDAGRSGTIIPGVQSLGLSQSG